jgi:N-acetylglutamate synthase-like GNAT family acetyltransferase
MVDHSIVGFRVSSDKADFDLMRVHRWLSEDAYWSKGIAIGTVERAFANSLAFHLLNERDEQVGVARMVTDRATFAYLADVYIDPKYRGRGLGIFLMDHITSHPDLQGLRRQILATSDMHGLYEKYGFTALTQPEILMEKLSTTTKCC